MVMSELIRSSERREWNRHAAEKRYQEAPGKDEERSGEIKKKMYNNFLIMVVLEFFLQWDSLESIPPSIN